MKHIWEKGDELEYSPSAKHSDASFKSPLTHLQVTWANDMPSQPSVNTAICFFSISSLIKVKRDKSIILACAKRGKKVAFLSENKDYK